MSAQNLGFADHNGGYTTDILSSPDATFDIGDFHDANLANFLSRPIRIKEVRWDLNTGLDQQFNPWTLFFSDPAVKKRVDNFARIRCKLHVKAVVNATPFHYGRTILSYIPWQSKNALYASPHPRGLASQRPFIFINPTDNMGGDMILPFFHVDNWIDATALSAFTELGDLELLSLNDLKHASGGTESINITFFAWAEDVKMCVPTTHLSAQAGKKKGSTKDEYGGGGVISKPASAIANAAGALMSIPVFAPYAMATQMAASAVSGIAKIFGFSRPVILTPTVFYKPALSSNTATCDQHETVSKLTIDSKQEITLDPRTTGLSDVDELSLAFLTQRESYLGQFTWRTTDSPDDLLWNSVVAPMLEAPGVTHNIGGVLHQPTSLSFATWPFAAWSGTIKFRFQVVCSSFHHGRLRFSYIPAGTASDTTTAFNTLYTEIMDIGAETDFELEVAWTGLKPYNHTDWDKNVDHFSPVTEMTTNSDHDNGLITVRVLNDLTAPENNADININVFISAGDDFELCEPTQNHLDNTSYFENPTPVRLMAQSGVAISAADDNPTKDDPDDAPIEPFVGASVPSITNQKSQIFYGEKVSTFRTLLRRYNKYRTWGYDTTTEAVGSVMQANMFKSYLPMQRGYDPVNGADTTLLGLKFNFVHVTLLSYLLPAYVGYRGAMRSKYRDLDLGQEIKGHMDVHRDFTPPGSKNYMTRKTIWKVGDSITAVSLRGSGGAGMWGGSIIQPITQSPYVEVEVPFYTGKRFAFAQRITSGGITTGMNDNTDHLETRVDYTYLTVAAGKAPGMIEEFISVGEDFNVFFFVGAPPRFDYPTPPA